MPNFPMARALPLSALSMLLLLAPGNLLAGDSGRRTLEKSVQLLENGKRAAARRGFLDVLFNGDSYEKGLARSYLRNMRYLGMEDAGPTEESPPLDPRLKSELISLGARENPFGVALEVPAERSRGRLRLSRRERETLRALSGALPRHPANYRVLVEVSVGGAGSEAARETRAQSLAAKAVRSLRRQGLAPDSLAAVGYAGKERGGRVDLIILPPARATKPWSPPAVHGRLRNETAYRPSRPGRFTKTRTTLALESAGALSKAVSYKASGRLFYDGIYDLDGRWPRLVEDDQEREAEIRDAYLDFSAGPFDARLGKQQVVWGEAVGTFVADVVNAKDLREFVLQDFDLIRIPQWMGNLEWTRGGLHLEGVWIPTLEFDRFGRPGSEFAPPRIPVPAGFSASEDPERRPKDTLKNGEFGGRASCLFGGWDLTAFHLHAWDRSPVLYRSFGANSIVLQPAYERLPLSGATFSKDAGAIVWKGEAVYQHGKRFSVTDPSDVDGVARKDLLDYLLGMDFTLADTVDVNLQFIQRAVFRYRESLFREERLRHAASLWLKTGLRRNTIEPEVLVVSDLERRDLMIRPKVTLTFAGRWRLRLGMDIFEGREQGFFGRFAARDRAYTDLMLSF